MVSHILGPIVEGSHGPYLANHGDRALLLTVAPNPRGILSWQARVLDERGELAHITHDLGPAPSSVELLSLRPGRAGGFILVWARRVDGGHAVEARILDGSGAPRGKTVLVHQTAEALVWVDAAASPTGNLVFFTLLTASGGRVHGMDLGEHGERGGSVHVLLDGAASWQTVATRKGTMLLAVLGQSHGPAAGRPVAVPLGEGARPSSPVPLQTEPVFGSEMEAAATPDRVFVAWDERGPFEPRVKIAALSHDGRLLRPPREALRSAGDQGLISLHPAQDGGLLVAWDDLALSRGPEGRWIRLTSFPADLRAPVAEGAIHYGLNDGSTPLIHAAPGGFAALTADRPCFGVEGCSKAPLSPVFLRLGADLSPGLQAPVLLPSGYPPEATLALRCGPTECSALALDERTSLLIRLEAEPSETWPPLVRRMDLPDIPGASSLATLWAGPRLAEVAVAPVHDGWVAASVTDHLEGSTPPPLPADVDQRAEAEKDRAHKRNAKSTPGRGAIVTVHPLEKDGSVGPPRTLSVRALSSPGVAIAGSPRRKEACLAWVARDNGDPEVFLTRVDHEGKRLGQQMLTRARGDVLDVAVAPVEDGWLVVWVDTRDGNGEVYAARVDGSLRRKGGEQRITSAPGDASELALLVQEQTAIVAFSDSRSAPSEGLGDVFVARLRADDGSKIGDEVRVASTPEHGRSLQLQSLGDSVLLAWLEHPPPSESQARSAQIHLTFLGPDGAIRSLPEVLELDKPGPLSSLSVRCQDASCSFVVGRPEGRQLWLSAFSWRRGERRLRLGDLAPLFAGAAADVTPVQGPGWVLVGDDSSAQEGRLRRVGIRWP
ncbi:MAG: hypothetical protein RMJ98_13325 [Myxococcales bacterium]|nr:hypothetical protein [Myxococcales bacterium]